MNEPDENITAAFSSFLVSLPDDTRALVEVLEQEATDRAVLRALARAANYLFKSLDLIDDGIEGLGYLDDALVLRMACDQAKERGPLPPTLERLAADAELVRTFLGPLAERMERYVSSLDEMVVRGRSVQTITEDPEARAELMSELNAWASRYKAPQFVPSELGLVKLRAFLAAKLPT